jgi:hypothetical protein
LAIIFFHIQTVFKKMLLVVEQFILVRFNEAGTLRFLQVARGCFPFLRLRGAREFVREPCRGFRRLRNQDADGQELMFIYII